MTTHPASDELTRMEVSKVELALVRHITGAECPNNMDRGVMDDGSHFPSFFSTDQRQMWPSLHPVTIVFWSGVTNMAEIQWVGGSFPHRVMGTISWFDTPTVIVIKNYLVWSWHVDYTSPNRSQILSRSLWCQSLDTIHTRACAHFTHEFVQSTFCSIQSGVLSNSIWNRNFDGICIKVSNILWKIFLGH